MDNKEPEKADTVNDDTMQTQNNLASQPSSPSGDGDPDKQTKKLECLHLKVMEVTKHAWKMKRLQELAKVIISTSESYESNLQKIEEATKKAEEDWETIKNAVSEMVTTTSHTNKQQ